MKILLDVLTIFRVRVRGEVGKGWEGKKEVEKRELKI
jgi:hypothetical protein